jgi:hypothetical protein
MPDFAAELWFGLGYSEPLAGGCWGRATDWVPAGQKLGELGREYFGRPETADAPALAAR